MLFDQLTYRCVVFVLFLSRSTLVSDTTFASIHNDEIEQNTYLWQVTQLEIERGDQLLNQKAYEKAESVLVNSQFKLQLLLFQPVNGNYHLCLLNQKLNATRALIAFLRHDFNQAIKNSQYALNQANSHPFIFRPKDFFLFQLELLQLQFSAQIELGDVVGAKRTFNQLVFLFDNGFLAQINGSGHQKKLILHYLKDWKLAMQNDDLSLGQRQLQKVWRLLKDEN